MVFLHRIAYGKRVNRRQAGSPVQRLKVVHQLLFSGLIQRYSQGRRPVDDPLAG